MKIQYLRHTLFTLILLLSFLGNSFPNNKLHKLAWNKPEFNNLWPENGMKKNYIGAKKMEFSCGNPGHYVWKHLGMYIIVWKCLYHVYDMSRCARTCSEHVWICPNISLKGMWSEERSWAWQYPFLCIF